MAVEHFDEGVYASNIFFGPEDGFRYPSQHLFAPPLLPWLIEWVFTFFGPSNLGAMLVSLVAGSLTVPLVWWVGRSWFGQTAGLAAATLCAFSDVHILFSRTALTDVLLCFWLLLAVYFIWLALTTGQWWTPIAAGMTTGLAWWTKYTGWLPLAIGLAGFVPWVILARRRNRRPENGPSASPSRGEADRPPPSEVAVSILRSFAVWAGITAIAFAVWAPWLWSLQDRGGYAAVAANHGGYLVGWTGWFNSLITQMFNLRAVDGWRSFHTTLLGVLVPLLYCTQGNARFTWNAVGCRLSSRPVIPVLAAMAIASLVLGGSVVVLLAGFFAACLPFPEESESPARAPVALGRWLFRAWYLGMFVSVPLYTPYPRLALPWIMASWFGAAILIRHLLPRPQSETESQAEIPPAEPRRSTSVIDRFGIGMTFRCASFAALFLACLTWEMLLMPKALAWSSRGDLLYGANQLIEAACKHAQVNSFTERDQIVIYAYGEPATLFQLRLRGFDHVRPVMHFAFARPNAPRPKIPTYVVVGRQARHTAGFEEQFAEAKPRLERVGEYPYQPSDLVLLDSRDSADRHRRDDRRREWSLELYRVR